MPNYRRNRGFSAERELVRKLWEYGFAAIRAPASGSGVKRAVYPDIVAIYKGKIFAIEVKYRSTMEPIYIDKEKVARLVEFAKRAGAEILVAVKIKNKGWYIIGLNECIKTEKGCKISLGKNKPSESLEEFVKSIRNKSLSHYIADAMHED